jgi:hypothetical protein
MLLFDEPGPVNTDKVIELAASLAGAYAHIVVASLSGDSALKLSERTAKSKIVCVTCPQGMYFEIDKMDRGPFNDIPGLRNIRDRWRSEGLRRAPMTMTGEMKERLRARHVPVVQGTIPFFGPSFSMRLHLNHSGAMDAAAKTLELISTGTLVCLETVLMAVDSGELPEGTETLALAGTEKGLDTVCVIRSAASANLYHPRKGARFIEFPAKPRIAYQPEINIDYIR